MNRAIFFEWLHNFDQHISITRGRRAVLLIDNDSRHGTYQTIPELRSVRVVFLPKRTTSRIQPLDAGIIASVKRRYLRHQIHRDMDLVQEGVYENIYQTDLRVVISAVHNIWSKLESSIIYNLLDQN